MKMEKDNIMTPYKKCVAALFDDTELGCIASLIFLIMFFGAPFLYLYAFNSTYLKTIGTYDFVSYKEATHDVKIECETHGYHTERENIYLIDYYNKNHTRIIHRKFTGQNIESPVIINNEKTANYITEFISYSEYVSLFGFFGSTSKKYDNPKSFRLSR